MNTAVILKISQTISVSALKLNPDLQRRLPVGKAQHFAASHLDRAPTDGYHCDPYTHTSYSRHLGYRFLPDTCGIFPCAWFTRHSAFRAKLGRMDIAAIAKAHNQKAALRNWNHFCDPSLAFTIPQYNQIISIWGTKAADRKMPRRSDMTARDLKDFLRDVLLLHRESVDPSRYTLRLIGTKVTEVVGHRTGKTLEESFSPQHLERWTETMDMILETQQPWRIRGRVHIRGREYLDAENLYFPLADDNDVPSYVMGLCRYTPHILDEENYWGNESASLPGGLI